MSLTIGTITAPISVRLRNGNVTGDRAVQRGGADWFGWDVWLQAGTPQSGEETSVVSVQGNGKLPFEVLRTAQVRLSWDYTMNGSQPSPPAMGFARYSLWFRVMGTPGPFVTGWDKRDLTVQSPGESGSPIHTLQPGKYEMEAILEMSVRVPRQESSVSALAEISQSRFRVSIA
jgi:hypothetical protein